MQQQVDPSRILDLSESMKRLNRAIEDNEPGLYKEVSSILNETRYSYSEFSNVQSVIRNMDQLLAEIHDLSRSISDQLDQKTTTLRQTADTYAQVEQQVKNILSNPTTISWSMNVGLLSKKMFSSVSSAEELPYQASPPSFLDMMKGLFLQAKKWYLKERLKSFQGDPQIANLLRQLKNGTVLEQNRAVEQLGQILSAIQGIARCQVAYDVYGQYGNDQYMEVVHQEAEGLRTKLRALGISDALVTANLAANYTGSALNACAYDPRLRDGSVMPTGLWGSEDGKLSEDKQIGIILLTDQYFKASTKEQREEILHMAGAIRDGSLSSYPLLGNKLGAESVSKLIQSLVNSKTAFVETIQSLEHDSKFAVFANANLSYHEEAVDQVMKVLTEDLVQAEKTYWNSGIYTEENWWLDPAKLAEALTMINRDARNGGLSLPEVSGNKMAALQYLLRVPVTKEWGMDTLNTLEIAMTQQGIEGDAHTLGEENLKAIVDRYIEIQTAPSVKWGQVGIGLLQTVGGGFEAAFGVAFGIATVETLAGGLFGAYVATHGASNVSGGISRMWNGLNGSDAGDTANFEKNAFAAIGGERGELVYNGIDMAMAFAQPVDIVTKMIYKSPTAALDAYQAEKIASSVFAKTEGAVVEGTGQGLKVPQGLTQAQFDKASSMIREKVGHISDDIVVQGSRAKGTAKPTSDIDIAIRVPAEKFDELIQSSFSKVKPPNPGSAKEKTMLHAIETGKIQSGEAKLSKFREQLQQELGMDVDISIIKIGGPFDNPPFTPLK
ncbi:nucleotidyltransferase domain-containing protein [Paenibacillus segetis]|uniref:Polymerase nucleotidyl transferase domain-containing protein n=1 Tax=Paenibacillus segetis TaxID=1325360 RepID=A0ABQ1Y3D7_9BACL|nr:nucleotidyltransferase domain-containing protein [Paenibacillus segetis]GGH10935.1 hypothetical protein GCM10008013_02560 [Paenibacillus segetis]